MKKKLFFCIISITSFMLSNAQQLQYSTWTRFDSFVNDTVFLHFTEHTFTYSKPDALLVLGNYTENGNIVTFQDVGCSTTVIGTYSFIIENGAFALLNFTLISDLCTDRANSLTEGAYIRMPPKTIHVPADFQTIQQGIDTADNNDIIIVSEGTYYEQINFMGKKPLTVASEFLMDGDKSHIAKTIIDGSQLKSSDSASVVYFVSGEDTTSVLNGFTIQGGNGTLTPDPFGDWDGRQGGGIWIQGAGAKILNNRITHNTVDDTQSEIETNADGGGIGTQWEDTEFWVVIANNTIDSNTCISDYYQAAGAGVNASYSTVMRNNIITHNTCIGQSDAVAIGGGACMAQFDFVNPLIFIAKDNTISYNVTQSTSMANSAGVLAEGTYLTFSGNDVFGNQVIDGAGIEYSGGGGLFVHDVKPGSVVSNNKFISNSSNFLSGAVHVKNYESTYNELLIENNYFMDNQAKMGGGAFTSIDVPVILQNNVFSGNHAQASGGAIGLGRYASEETGHFATFVNNSFYGNKAGAPGGAIYSPYHTKILILNSVFYGDSATLWNEIYTLDTVEIAYSNINLDEVTGIVINGGGNINQDPMFDDLELLTLAQGSPCVNAGKDSFVCYHGITTMAPLYDILGSIRPQDGQFDIGAYESELYQFVEKTVNNADSWFSNYPNPFKGKTQFSYELSSKTIVEISVFNSTGTQIQTLVSEIQEAGKHSLEFNAGNLSAGIYYYLIQAGNRSGTGKMIVLK